LNACPETALVGVCLSPAGFVGHATIRRHERSGNTEPKKSPLILARKRNGQRADVPVVVSVIFVVLGSRAGHVTSKNAARGPRNSVRRNHVHADRFRVRAYPPARIATVNQTNPMAELSQLMRRG
jgi:hypothetical protein